VGMSFAISICHSMLSGTASMDFGGKKAAGTATGIFDGMQYLAGSVVGIGMGYMLETFGWASWGPSMIGFSGVGMFLMLALWNARPKTSVDLEGASLGNGLARGTAAAGLAASAGPAKS